MNDEEPCEHGKSGSHVVYEKPWHWCGGPVGVATAPEPPPTVVVDPDGVVWTQAKVDALNARSAAAHRPAAPESSEEQPVEIFGKPYHGWTCDCGDCLDHDARGVPRPGEGRS